ncbi:gamma-tubulin complex component 2-like isoform X2 [Paramacrobiotus metropolitanus]|nr:gamma-tubulin complex component 2-like isoform X2 [Paramacrobiotus metropolitanus]
MCLDFSDYVPDARSANLAPIGGLPYLVQESIVVRELLLVLEGYQGIYITTPPLQNEDTTRDFNVDSSLDLALKHTVEELIPCASMYSTLAQFVDSAGDPKMGMTVRAFAHAIRQFLRDYKSFMVELDDVFRDGQLTIQRLHSQMMPLFPALEMMAGIVQTVTEGKLRGGALLSALHDRVVRFSPKKEIEQLVLHVVTATAVPFLRMLSKWIYEGVVEDPHREFMVCIYNVEIKRSKQQSDKGNVNTGIHTCAYWENRYKLVQTMVPDFMEEYTEKIVLCGKYLNIIRQCGEEISVADASPLAYNRDPRHLQMLVDDAFTMASGRLLTLMMESEDLITRLRSVKHFFLLDHDDFIAEFLSFAAHELTLPLSGQVVTVNKPFVYSAFEDALRYSTLYHDPYKKMMKPTFSKFNILQIHAKDRKNHNQISSSSSSSSDILLGMDSFSMNCEIQFPFCLIIYDEAKFHYQMLFKLFFRLKLIEYHLSRVRMNCKDPICRQYKPYCLPFVHQMRDFINSLQQYFSAEVIEPLWHAMMQQIRTAKTFDEVFVLHREFISTCANDCFLGDRDILSQLYRLLDGCLKLSADLMDPQFFAGDDCLAKIDKMRARFTHRMVSLLEHMSNTSETREFEGRLLSAMHRLDYNMFYTVKLAERVREKAQSNSHSSHASTAAGTLSSHSSRTSSHQAPASRSVASLAIGTISRN